MPEEMEVASAAAKLSAIPALAALLSRSSGHSEAHRRLFFRFLLQHHGFEEALGALANLASGSADRQIQIYKAGNGAMPVLVGYATNT